MRTIHLLYLSYRFSMDIPAHFVHSLLLVMKEHFETIFIAIITSNVQQNIKNDSDLYRLKSNFNPGIIRHVKDDNTGLSIFRRMIVLNIIQKLSLFQQPMMMNQYQTAISVPIIINTSMDTNVPKKTHGFSEWDGRNSLKNAPYN